MRAISGKDLCKVLERRGWSRLRVTGSHHIYGKAGTAVRLSVPVHAQKTLKAGLTAHLLRMAGLSESDL